MTCSICPTSARIDARLGVEGHTESDVLAQSAPNESRETGNDLVEVDGVELQDLFASKREELPDEIARTFSGSGDLAELSVARIGRGRISEKHFGVAEDRRKKIVEIVSHTCRQTPNRFHLEGLPELFFGSFAFGDVDRDSEEAMDDAFGVPHGRNGQQDRQAGTVLADVGPLAFFPLSVFRAREEHPHSGGLGNGEFGSQFNRSRFHFVGIVEDLGRLAADKLVGLISEHALGGRVEGGDDAVGRRGDDAVSGAFKDGLLQHGNAAQGILGARTLVHLGLEALDLLPGESPTQRSDDEDDGNGEQDHANGYVPDEVGLVAMECLGTFLHGVVDGVGVCACADDPIPLGHVLDEGDFPIAFRGGFPVNDLGPIIADDAFAAAQGDSVECNEQVYGLDSTRRAGRP